MNRNVDQLELIAIMFKIQFGEKTLDEVFSRNDCLYKGKIKDFTIKRCITFNCDINFYNKQGKIVMYFGPENLVLPGNDTNRKSPIDQIIQMLDFTDKI